MAGKNGSVDGGGEYREKFKEFFLWYRGVMRRLPPGNRTGKVEHWPPKDYRMRLRKLRALEHLVEQLQLTTAQVTEIREDVLDELRSVQGQEAHE